MDFCTTLSCLQWKHKLASRAEIAHCRFSQGQVLSLVVDIKGQINTHHTSALTACSRDHLAGSCSLSKPHFVNLPCFTWVRQSLDRPNMDWTICLGASKVIQKQSNIKRSDQYTPMWKMGFWIPEENKGGGGKLSYTWSPSGASHLFSFLRSSSPAIILCCPSTTFSSKLVLIPTDKANFIHHQCAGNDFVYLYCTATERQWDLWLSD